MRRIAIDSYLCSFQKCVCVIYEDVSHGRVSKSKKNNCVLNRATGLYEKSLSKYDGNNDIVAPKTMLFQMCPRRFPLSLHRHSLIPLCWHFNPAATLTRKTNQPRVRNLTPISEQYQPSCCSSCLNGDKKQCGKKQLHIRYDISIAHQKPANTHKNKTEHQIMLLQQQSKQKRRR